MNYNKYKGPISHIANPSNTVVLEPTLLINFNLSKSITHPNNIGISKTLEIKQEFELENWFLKLVFIHFSVTNNSHDSPSLTAQNYALQYN